MRIALDYDGTVTADHAFWIQFVSMAEARGHEVHIVTMRYPHEPIDDYTFRAVHGRVQYTSRQLKLPYTLKQNLTFAIWIDDSPGLVTGGADRLQWNDWVDSDGL